MYTSYAHFYNLTPFLPLIHPSTTSYQTLYEVSEHNRKEAECAMAKCRRVRREKNEQIDALKVKHRQSMQQHKKSHAAKVKAKNKLLDDMWKEVEHARENVSLILDELGQEKKKSRRSKKKAAAAELRAHKAARGWKSLMEKHAELNDESLAWSDLML